MTDEPQLSPRLSPERKQELLELARPIHAKEYQAYLKRTKRMTNFDRKAEHWAEIVEPAIKPLGLNYREGLVFSAMFAVLDKEAADNKKAV